MGFRRELVTDWTQRDRLAVLTVAVTVAFFTGTVLVTTALTGQLTGIAAEFDTPASVEYVEEPGEGGDGVATLPVATWEDNGSQRTLVGASPESARRIAEVSGEPLPAPPESGASIGAGGVGTEERIIVRTGSGSQSIAVMERSGGRTVLPDHWYLANESVVEQSGPDGTLRVEQAEGNNTVPQQGTPLRGALAFFLAGSESLLYLLVAGGIGAATLAGVTVYSVVRMTVRDREKQIKVARAVGGQQRTLLGLFVARGALVSVIGIGLGYAIGVIGANAAANVAVFAGVPTSLSMQVTEAAVGPLVVGYGIVLGGGATGAGIAALPTLRRAPAQIGVRREADGGSRVPGFLQLRLLDWRALVPTAASLTVFVTVVLLLASVGGALGPLFGGTGATVSEPGAVHPVASKVPASYASLLESEDRTASPEVLAFTTVDGEEVLVRGVRYDDYATVSDASLVAGRAPRDRDEAVVGVDLADRLDVAVGDTLTVGGSTSAGVTRVTVVGTYRAPGYYDDHLLVSLATGRHLAGIRGDRVHVIRLSEELQADGRAATGGLRAVDISVPDTAAAGSDVTVRATLVNPTAASITREVVVQVGSETRTVSTRVRPFGSRQVRTSLPVSETGETRVTVLNRSTTLTVRSPDALTVSVPETVPSNATLRLQVSTVGGAPATNATVQLGNTTAQTDENGVATIATPAAGAATLSVSAGDRSLTRSLTVSDTARRQLDTRWAAPERVTPLTNVRATLVVSNPWNRTVERTITLDRPGGSRTETVRLAPGERTTLVVSIGRLAPGTYSLTARAGDTPLATRSIEVTGDDRLAAAIATNGAVDGGGTTVGRAISTVLGNVQVLVGVLLALAALTTVASTTAAFARSVRARFYAVGLYRTVGARRWQVVQIAFSDALRIGSVASLAGLIGGMLAVWGLDALGLLAIFGVDVPLRITVDALAVALAGSSLLVFVGTLLALVPALQAQPTALLARQE